MVLSYKKIIFIVFILLLKTKEGFTASIDTTNLLAFPQSVYEASPVTFNSGDYVTDLWRKFKLKVAKNFLAKAIPHFKFTSFFQNVQGHLKPCPILLC